MSVEIETFDAKQPGEGLYYLLDFTKDFRPEGITTTAGDTIASCTVTVDDEAGVDVTATLVDATKQVLSGCYAYIFLHAGTNGKTYKGTGVALSTPSGQTAEIDFYLPVVEA
jgi:hypothetical protein